MLKSKLDSGSPYFVAFFDLEHVTLITLAFWFLYCLFKRLMYSCSMPQVFREPHIELWVMGSNAFMKSFVATHILTLHSWHFCSIFCMSLNDPSLGRNAGTLPDLRIEFDQVWNVVKMVDNSLYCAGEVQIRRWFPTSSSFLFLWIIFIRTLCHVSGVQLSCFNTSLKICFTIPFVATSQFLMSSARIPLLSLALPFLSLLIAA